MARKKQPFTIRPMKPMKRNQFDKSQYLNPFEYDHVRMGVPIGKNVTIMHMSPQDEVEYVVIVDNKTGARIQVMINSFNKTINEE